MRIAFITYEYPPDIAQGGIATYVQQAAYNLKQAGHDIEIFCGSHTRTISENINNILVHRCITKNPDSFRNDCVGIFTERHLSLPFDIIESPEILGNAIAIKEKFPELPMVVKLHMALFIQMRLYNFYTSRLTKLRFFLGALRRGRIRRFGQYDYKNDTDYKIAAMADAVISPSASLRDIILKEWHLPPEFIKLIPYSFSPPETLLNIPVENKVEKNVSFFGKLNVHKGIVNLIKVIPLVVKKHPDVVFRLFGNDSYFTVKKMNMSAYIRKQLKGYEKNYTIEGGLDYEAYLNQYRSTAICIYPSIWENFPLVCYEAMSAGRAIIGSREGGMKEMLENGAGVIVDPLDINEMANAVTRLLDNEKLRHQYGTIARAAVLKNYNKELIGKQIEDHYRQVINKKRNAPEFAKN